jgi:hypothetical protein
MSPLAQITQQFDPAAFRSTGQLATRKKGVWRAICSLSLQTVLLEAWPDLPPFKSAQVSLIGRFQRVVYRCAT